ncbi:hypothetical protein N5C66_00475 [Rhizobium pusense]|jgi:hypothetical protein|uniref:Lipoprotein n=2 Tax=Agrobacterium TaxID=357 RepID=A0A1L9CWU9_9HYPH|nr:MULTISPECIES: hypothetical protein [Rhizobium/Agrobacterium group]AMD60993.1 hypothetical protein AWN88_23080 [Agrobacterium tumefaciens]ANV24660.1 hypothetical protein BA939_12380 [Rhizobium sp. S41]AUC09039.1 hypothetical protein BLX90_01720 [Rhizobium sp. Y9]KGE82843.1 lipoprotein [Rhizobium sp. H41]KIV68534.1 hypothetical protein SZ54_0051 [Rhizobium sp. UR51a]MBB2904218.1 hypothetical protein [Rhizobium sp. RAS22]MBM7326242.1 hypothetical protein [Agrobacterium sp. S2]MDP9732428.1 h
MKTMQGNAQGLGMFRTVVGVTTIGVLLGACTSPTYGTGKTAAEQLVDDLGNATSITGDQTKRNLKYGPRPGLVVPAQARAEQLAQPQQNMASRENNPQWVESPEETRERLRDEADANKNNPHYRSPLLAGNGTAGQMTESQKWEAFRKAKAEAQGGSVVNAQRKFLTDPPAEYRSVPQDQLTDLGEPEQKKEKRRKKEAAMAGTGKSWWNPFQ